MSRPRARKWWLVIEPDVVDVCDVDPGYPVTVTVTTTLPLMVEIWRGDREWAEALRSGRAGHAGGHAALRRAVPRWFTLSAFANVPRPLSKTGVSGQFGPTERDDRGSWCTGPRGVTCSQNTYRCGTCHVRTAESIARSRAPDRPSVPHFTLPEHAARRTGASARNAGWGTATESQTRRARAIELSVECVRRRPAHASCLAVLLPSLFLRDVVRARGGHECRLCSMLRDGLCAALHTAPHLRVRVRAGDEDRENWHSQLGRLRVRKLLTCANTSRFESSAANRQRADSTVHNPIVRVSIW